MDNRGEAYIVACGTMLESEADPEYSKRAAEPAAEAGLTLIAGGPVGDKVEVLEGALPEGTQFMAIERFPSMEALQSFWHSEGYQSAIPFRRESVKMHFIVALEGVVAEEPTAELKQAQD
jgi:uncharacterized protein (DUF1330 family)